MKFNLNKGDRIGKYSYSKNNITFGPICLEDLKKRVEKNTLVYVEGIGWDKAQNLPELKEYLRINSKFSYKLLALISSSLVIAISITVLLYPFKKPNRIIGEEINIMKDTLLTRNHSDTTQEPLPSSNLKDTITIKRVAKNIATIPTPEVLIDESITTYNQKKDPIDKANYFIENMLSKGKIIYEKSISNREQYKGALTSCYLSLIGLIPERDDSNYSLFCNYRVDLEYQMEILNCPINQQVQEKLRKKCL